MKVTKSMIQKAAHESNLAQLKMYENSAKIEILMEAIEIFKKVKNEPMTGNVVILELRGLLYKLQEEE